MKINIKNIQNPNEILTQRLLLKPVNSSSKNDVFKILSNPEIRQTTCLPILDTEEKFELWWQQHLQWRTENKSVRWCAYLKENQRFVGLMTLKEISEMSLRTEIGYSLLPEFWGKGLATEAVSAVLEYGFEKINFHSIFAMILTQNNLSLKLIQNLGFEQEGYFKESHFYDGKFWDVLQFVKFDSH